MISFIHIPKTGGSTIWKFLNKNYTNEFMFENRTPYHSLRAVNIPKDITIVTSVRDPYERFLSTYSYYLYGSDMWSHRHAYRRTENIKEFIIDILPVILKTNQIDGDVVWRNHFLKQAYFLDPSRHEDTILILYNNELYDNLKTISKYLHENMDFPLADKDLDKKTHNKTLRYKELTPEDSDYVKSFVKRFYKEDYNLFSLIKNQPERFKKIIGC